MIHADESGSILVELAERIGPSLEHWIDQPLAYVRWVFGHLQELDRRRAWVRQVSEVDAAWLHAKSFHDPNALKEDHRMLISQAAGTRDTALAVVRGARMLDELAKVMEDGNVEHSE